MQAMQTSMGFPLGMSGALPCALSGAYPGPPVIPTTRTPTRLPTQMASTTVSSSPDTISLLQRTLAQKESEISKLKAEGEANVRRYEQQLQEVNIFWMVDEACIRSAIAVLRKICPAVQIPLHFPLLLAVRAYDIGV